MASGRVQDERNDVEKQDTAAAATTSEEHKRRTTREERPVSGRRPLLGSDQYAQDGYCAFLEFEAWHQRSIRLYQDRITARVSGLEPWRTDVPGELKTEAPVDETILEEVAALLRVYSEQIRAYDEMLKRRHVRGYFFDDGQNRACLFNWELIHEAKNPDLSVRVATNRHIPSYVKEGLWKVMDVFAGDSWNDAFGRVALAVTGGASLLVPMIIMTFAVSRTARLIVVSVAVVIFAVGMAAATTSRENILGATAAYAAVMVVYVGNALPSSG